MKGSLFACGDAASLSTLLLLATASFTSAQPSTSVPSANAVVSNVAGGRANVTTNGNARGFITIAVNGMNKTIGATSAGGLMPNSTFLEFFGSFPLPVPSPPDTDPTTGVPAPPVVSPPDDMSPPGPGPMAGEEGAVRLVSRVDVNGFATGALQVFCEGAWGAVCTSNFDDIDAVVACRQLGFTTGVSQPQEPTFRRTQPDPEIVAPFAIENLGCTGTETRIVDCPVAVEDDTDEGRDYNYRFRDYTNSEICDPFQGTFAKVACGTSETADEGDLRLANGVMAADGSAEYGRLEIFHTGGFGTVCDNAGINRFNRRPGFNDNSANVACRQLGYQQGVQIQKLEDEDEASTSRVPIVLGGSQCRGTEAALSACPDFELGQVGSTCGHDADVHLVCFNGPNPEMDGMTRLVAGSAGAGYEYGRLEIFERGFWSNVCNNDRFTPDAAQVACRAFGYDGGAALRFTQSYANSLSQVLFENLPVALAAVDCDGDETSIAECQNNDSLIGMCTNITSSTVLACANSEPGCTVEEGTTEGAVRLRGGFGTLCDPVHSGFIEVLHFGEWGSICTDRFSEDQAEDNLVADVVCRQLGFPHGTRVDPLTAQPPPPTPDPDEAPSPYSSYYYSYYYDYTATVEEAEEPVDLFWLSSVECSGPEGRLIDCNLGPGFRRNGGCRFRPHRIHIACRQFPVVEALEAIVTPGAEEGDVRLVEEEPIANWMTGRLQVFFEGSWSQVCAGAFGSPDANVACRQLGFGAGTVVPQILTDAERIALRSTPVFPEVAITGSGCTGTEERLLDCSPEDDPFLFFSRDCLNSNGAGLVLGCVGAPGTGTEGAFRLTDTSVEATPDSESGILEVFHAGAWGTLCRGDFGILDSTPQIACRDMGFTTGFFQDASPAAALLPPWLSGIRCAGPEANVGACRRSDFGETDTCGAIQRLFCFSSRGSNGQVRLVDGGADAGGAYEYGRLEVLINSVWSIVDERFGEDLGRRGAQVACRTLGFATGAQLLVGQSSPFPAPPGSPRLITDITCDGSEANLAACDIDVNDYDYYYFRGDYRPDGIIGAVSLVCTTPSGCGGPAPTPTEGDVRLVPLNATSPATAACDEVHFGGVELFREGAWGRICVGRFGGDPEEFTLDAQVVCRQLGFPFGTVMDEGEVFGAYDYRTYDYGSTPDGPEIITWATEVVCTGKEERLLDCDFPQDFGVDYTSPYDYRDYFNENWPAPSHAAPQEAPTENAPPPAGSLGLPNGGCERSDRNRLAVICRRFEITESDFIRR